MLAKPLLRGLRALPLLALLGAPVHAAEPIVIGELNSYTRLAAFTEPYRKGWTLALEQVNAQGGLLGRPVEIVARDDLGDPAAAIRIAEELFNDGAVMVFGGFLSNVGLAIADLANQKGFFYLASEPLSDALVWSKGNRFTYRLRPSTHMQTAMLAVEAAKLEGTRWATVAPNYAYGRDAVEAFQASLLALRPDVVFVDSQWPPLFRIDAGSTVRAVERAKPDGIFNVTFAGDLAKFVREGALRRTFENRMVVSLLSGEPEYLEPLGAEAPEGWIVTGYPGVDVDTPAHDAFETAYIDRWAEAPKTGSIVGYNSILTIKAAIEAAGSVETEAMLAAMEGLVVPTSPSGPFTYRAADHQATMGAWVGRTALVDGQPRMVDWRYEDGANHLPSEEEAAALRPAE